MDYGLSPLKARLLPPYAYDTVAAAKVENIITICLRHTAHDGHFRAHNTPSLSTHFSISKMIGFYAISTLSPAAARVKMARAIVLSLILLMMMRTERRAMLSIFRQIIFMLR